MVLFKSLLKAGPQFERLTLIFGEKCEDAGYYSKTSREESAKDSDAFVDILVELVLKLKRLTCLCLIFYDDDVDYSMICEARQRIEKEILSKRPALWVHMDRDFPNVVDYDVPSVHFHEMVLPTKIDPPPAFWILILFLLVLKSELNDMLRNMELSTVEYLWRSFYRNIISSSLAKIIKKKISLL